VVRISGCEVPQTPITQGFWGSEDSGRVRYIPDASGEVEGLKIYCSQERGGSIPFRATKKTTSMVVVSFCILIFYLFILLFSLKYVIST